MAKPKSGASSALRLQRGQSPPVFTPEHRLKLEGMIYGGFGVIYPERALVIAAVLGEIDRLVALLKSNGEATQHDGSRKESPDEGNVPSEC